MERRCPLRVEKVFGLAGLAGLGWVTDRGRGLPERRGLHRKPFRGRRVGSMIDARRSPGGVRGGLAGRTPSPKQAAVVNQFNLKEAWYENSAPNADLMEASCENEAPSANSNEDSRQTFA